jgi:hypothetical protein
MKRSALVLVLGVVIAACGGNTAATTTVAETSTTTAAPTTTVADTSTTTAAATTTTGATTTTSAEATTTTAGEYFALDPNALFPVVFGSPGDPNGSGCVTLGTLGSGVWFGYATAVSGGTITFDLACFFTGDAATAAAQQDGAEAYDFYIRNQNPATYDVPIAQNAEVFIVQDTMDGIQSVQIATANWPSPDSYLVCPGEYCAVWLYVNGGEATGIVEQYLP